MKTKKHKCRAVVVGTGAGGGVAGAILAESGVDTIIVEEGQYYRPEDHGDEFTGVVRMYYNSASSITFGRPPISVTLGSTVGGTTAINSSTCFRPPRSIVESWGGPSWDELVPFFETVEKRINAHQVDVELLGGNWKMLKRGCDRLGVEIKPLTHNVKNCKGRGRCQYGCKEGAKQSTDISYIPGALEAGAQLLTSHHVDRIIMERGRAAGVAGSCGGGERFEVQADHVVIAMGALRTPCFLLRDRVANSSGRVGRGLQIHPAARTVAEFDEIVDGHRGLPQGAYIDKWADRGIMLEGIFLPPGLLLALMPFAGEEFKDLAASYRRLSAFGVMVHDTSVGSVRPGHFGSDFLAIYQLNQRDAESLRFGIARVAEIYLESGAKRVFTAFHPVPVVDSRESLKELEAAPMKPSDLEMAAFHPLGTCGMGADPKKSVVDFSLKCHDIENLYIMDGSVVPGSLGVNPQITIMGLATRGAQLLADKINAS